MLLNNGCLCCTVRGDLVRMISELVAKKKGKFDHIVIETTGKRLFICVHIFPVVRVCQIFDYFLFFLDTQLALCLPTHASSCSLKIWSVNTIAPLGFSILHSLSIFQLSLQSL